MNCTLITPAPQCQIVTATKDLVDELIAMDTHNRAKNKRRIAYYSALMNSGKWMLNNQGIGVSRCGVVLDGGHRLAAMRNAGYPPIQFILVTGLQSESQLGIDDLFKRTTPSQVHLALDVSMNNSLAGALRMVGRWSAATGLPSYDKSLDVSASEISECYIDWSSEIETMSDLMPKHGYRSGVRAALLVYLRKNKAKAAQFIRALVADDMLKSGTPVHSLSRYIKGNIRTGAGNDRQREDFLKTLSCCKADNEGRVLARVCECDGSWT